MSSRFETNQDVLFNHDYSFSDQILKQCNIGEYDHIDRETNGSVDLREVVGTINGNYSDKKWGDILRNNWFQHPLETLSKLQSNPEYYLSKNKKAEWSFAKIHGKYYIDGGSHRTLIGRAFLEYNDLPPIIHGVTIEHYQGAIKPEDIFYDSEPEKKPDYSSWLMVVVCLAGLGIYNFFF